MLAALLHEDPFIFLGQIKTMFGQDTQPKPHRNLSIRRYIQQNIAPDLFTLIGTINEAEGMEDLDDLPSWQAIELVPLDTPWT